MVAFQTKGIDIDFAADRREEVKQYLEQRYNKAGLQRVFSAGTFTTIKLKTAIKDICRVHRVSVGTANYITSMVDDDKMTWTDFMRLGVKDKMVRDFIENNYEVFEEIMPLMEQARSAGIHASAVIVTPEYVKGQRVSCFDLLPIRKMDGLLVSEISGNDIDAIGILKCDALAIQELTRLSDMLHLIETQYRRKLTTLQIVSNELNRSEVYELISKGYTQGVFQMSGDGITRFVKQLKPTCIDDMIAMVAIFRPGALSSGAAQAYVDAHNGLIEPTYLWGTEETLKSTFGQIIYQEQVAELARKIGGLSLGEGVNLVKALSKKKLEKVRKFKEKFFEGAKQNGCPDEAARQLWDDTEKASSYLFNKSHSTAYGLTAFIGAWIKTYYPLPFYTVVLRDVDEKKLPAVMSEIDKFGKIKLVQPDINISGTDFTPDYKNNVIYWSLSRIKFIGNEAVNYIMREREGYGEFLGLEDFIKRIFRNKFNKKEKKEDETEITRNPVNVRVVKNLIIAGAFDKCEKLQSVCERYGLLERAANLLGYDIDEEAFPENMIDKHYFWSKQQISLTGIGYVNYRAIWNSLEKPKSVSRHTFIDFAKLDSITEATRNVAVATIVEAKDKTFKSHKDGSTQHFGKVILQQNIYLASVTIWGDAWAENKELFLGKEGSIIASTVCVKYSDYEEKNVLQINKGSFIKAI